MIEEFEGISSGDYEGFCWDVNKQTFKRTTGRNPSKYIFYVEEK